MENNKNSRKLQRKFWYQTEISKIAPIEKKKEKKKRNNKNETRLSIFT